MAKWCDRLREECAESCAEFGDPSCEAVEPGCDPCSDCLRACGYEVPEPIDPAAVVAPLL